MNFKRIFQLLKDTVQEWSEDKAPQLAAALSYYTAFSIAPLLVIAIGIAGLVWGRQAAEGAIVNQISGLVGQGAAQTIQTMIQNVNQQRTGLIATVIGLVTLVLGATGVFGQLQSSLNTMWEVQPKPNQGIMLVIRKRFFSFGMVVAIGFLLLVSLAVTAALSAFGGWLNARIPGGDIIMQIINFLVSFAVITFLFALIFKYVPDAKIDWKDVWLGAAVTSILFTLGKMAIGLYLGNSSIATTFGAAGSFIVILVWVYYSAQILFFGAEFTQTYARSHGEEVVPAKDAERVSEDQRARQGIPHKQPPQPARQPGITVPQTIPVTGQADLARPALPSPTKYPFFASPIWEAIYPAILALFVGVVGSLMIVREQKNLLPVRVRQTPVKAEVDVSVKAKRGTKVTRGKNR